MADPQTNESLVRGLLTGGAGTVGVLAGTFFNSLWRQLSAVGKQDSGVNKNLIDENNRLIAENKRHVEEKSAAQAREDTARRQVDEARKQIDQLYDDLDALRTQLTISDDLSALRLKARNDARAQLNVLQAQHGLPLTQWPPDPPESAAHD